MHTFLLIDWYSNSSCFGLLDVWHKFQKAKVHHVLFFIHVFMLRHVPEWLKCGCSLASVSNLVWAVTSRGRDIRQDSVCWPSLPGPWPTVGWVDTPLQGVHRISVPTTEWALQEPSSHHRYWGRVAPERSDVQTAQTQAPACAHVWWALASLSFTKVLERQMYSAVSWSGWQGNQPHPIPFVMSTKSSMYLLFSLPHIIYTVHPVLTCRLKMQNR